MISFGLSSMKLIFCKLLIMACSCGNAFSYCFFEPRFGRRWQSPIFAVWFDCFNWPLVCAWYVVKKNRSTFNFLKMAPQNSATNCLLRAEKIALGSPQLTRLSWSSSSVAHFLAPHAIFPAANVTCLLYMSVTDMAESKPLENVGKVRIKSIVIVWALGARWLAVVIRTASSVVSSVAGIWGSGATFCAVAWQCGKYKVFKRVVDVFARILCDLSCHAPG